MALKAAASIRSLAALLVALLICASGCEHKASATQLLVVVNSDFIPKLELSSVVLRVDSYPERTVQVLAFGTANANPAFGQANLQMLPFSFAVQPRSGNLDAQVTIEAEGRSSDGTILALARARVGFVAGQVHVLTLELMRACGALFATCGPEEACREATCDSLEVDVRSLPTVSPGRELRGVRPLSPPCRSERECALAIVDAGGEQRDDEAGETDSDQVDVLVEDARESAAESGQETPMDGAVAAPHAASSLTEIDGGGEPDDALVNQPISEPEIPERQNCQRNLGYFRDVGRPLARNLDGIQCPAVTIGGEWGSSVSTLEDNVREVTAYLQRCLDARADVLGLNVAFLDGKLLAFGFPPAQLSQASNLPTLRDLLALPLLSNADQPLSITLYEPTLPTDAVANALVTVLRETNVTHACRPIYLSATGVTAFEALRSVRRQLARSADPQLATLWPLTHFSRTLYSLGSSTVVREMAESVGSGFDMVRLGVWRVQLPPVLAHAKGLGLAVSLFDSLDSPMTITLCGLAASVEKLVRTDRPDFLRYFDETRQSVERSRLLLELDVSAANPASRQLSYQGFPSVTPERSFALGNGSDALPTLEQSAEAELHAGAFLRFDATRRQRLVLYDADDTTRMPDLGYFSYPKLAVAMVVRFPYSELPAGSRQVLASKLEGETGWSLAYLNAGAGTVLQLIYYGVGTDDNVVRKTELTFPLASIGLQNNGVHLVYAEALGGVVSMQVDGVYVEKNVTEPPTAHAATHNHVPITLGSDPDGAAGFFDGALQAVRIVSVY